MRYYTAIALARVRVFRNFVISPLRSNISAPQSNHSYKWIWAKPFANAELRCQILYIFLLTCTDSDSYMNMSVCVCMLWCSQMHMRYILFECRVFSGQLLVCQFADSYANHSCRDLSAKLQFFISFHISILLCFVRGTLFWNLHAVSSKEKRKIKSKKLQITFYNNALSNLGDSCLSGISKGLNNRVGPKVLSARETLSAATK